MEGEICAVMDARRAQVYNARFAAEEGKPVRLSEDRAISLEELTAEAKKSGKLQIIVGDGVITYLAVSVIRIDHLLLGFMLKLCVAVVIPNALLAAVYFRTSEFAYIKDFVGAVLKRLRMMQKC